MTRKKVVVQTIVCDICRKEVKSATTHVIAFDADRWEIDVCAKDERPLRATFAAWSATARPLTGRRRTARQAEDEWGYLESLGFTRHRGRKSAAETAALANR